MADSIGRAANVLKMISSSMNMRSPVAAILWEIWRVTRTEVAWRLALGIAGALIALFLFAASAPTDNPAKAKDVGAVIAFVVLVAPNFLGWAFLSRLNGGRAGYPLPLLYTRPVGTVTFVGLQFAYLTAAPAAIYLVSALLLKLISGYPFPLLSVAAWIAATTLIMTAIYWSTRSVLIQQVVGAVVSGAWLIYAIHRLTSFADGSDWHDSPKLWPTVFDLALTDYAVMALISLALCGITIASVARQRRGDARAAWTPGSGWPVWLVNLFRFPCPASSATRAQVWFDLKSKGLPVLMLGVALAILNPLLFAFSNQIDSANPDWSIPLGPMALMLAMMSMPAVLAIGGANAFGMRWRQGGAHFEATQPYSTAQLACLKVLVRSTCLLAALIAVGASVWIYLSFFPLHTGDKLFYKMAGVPLTTWQHGIASAVGSLAGHEQLSLVVVAVFGIVVWVTALAVILPLWFRYPRHGNILASVLLLGGLALAALALGGRIGIVSYFLVDAIFAATRWTATAATILATVYLFWSGVVERLLSVRYAFGAFVISAAFGAAWLTLLSVAGLQLAEMSTASAAWILSPLLVPLMASVLVPWSLSRFRHI